jgi:hypothetical protein
VSRKGKLSPSSQSALYNIKKTATAASRKIIKKEIISSVFSEEKKFFSTQIIFVII